MLMKNNFQSKSVPRGTRTIWRYLGALFILFTFAVGNVLAATEVRFLSANKNDANENFAAMSTSSNTTQLVGSGTAKLIAIGSAGLNDANKQIGYRSDGRLDIVFKFDGTASLDIYVNANGSSNRSFELRSFSSTKALSAIVASDYSSATKVTSNVSVTGAEFSSASYSTSAGGGSVSSGNITMSSSGGIKISYSSLAAGYYVFKSTGSSSSYIYGFDATVSGSVDPGDDTTAPTLASSVPANSATDVAVSGNIVLTMSENVTIADASKFSISGGAGSLTTASITASGKNVTIPYTGLANSTAYTLTVAANAIQDGAATPNKNAAFSISFTTAAPVVEPDYLLINQSNGNINTTHFRYTGSSSEKSGGYTVDGTKYNRYTQLGGAFTTPVGAKETNKIVSYDAKTNSVTAEAWIFNKASSDYKFYISMIEEGTKTPTIKEFDAPKNSGTKATWTFTPTKNATIYLTVGNNSNVHVCQFGITENGTDLLRGGQIGYSVRLDSCRLANNKNATPFVMDGISYLATSNTVNIWTPGNPVKLKATTEYIKFTLPTVAKVSIKATGTYSVTKTEGYSAGASMSNNQDVTLTADTWYICPNGSNVSFVSLEFKTPPTMRTISFDSDGGSAVTAIQVEDGTPATKPADPTWAHHRFDGWYNGSDPYVWTSNVTSNLTLTAHWTQLYTVTYANGEESATGDAPTQDELAAGEKFTVAANPFAYDGHDFSTWNDGSADVAPGTEYTMGAANVTLTAQWITATTKVTVTYKDGETTLGSEEITINTGNPVGYATYQTRNLATFDGWYNDPDLAEGHKIADISALTASANVNVYGKWNYQYASSTNIEQWVLDNGKGAKTTDLLSQLGSHYFATGITYVAGTNELDSLNDDPSKDNRNYAYLGLKVKTSGAMLDFRLQNGQTVKVKFGNVGTTPKVQYNNTGDYANMTITDGVYSYTATGNDYISIKTADAKAVVFKQIMIGADPAIAAVTLPWRVTYDANGGTCGTVSAIWSGAALILPDVTPADADHTFAGWYDEVSGGSLQGVAGASYTPTDNITLHAQFAPVEYAIAYDGNGATSGSMSAGVAGWGTMVTPDANAFVKTGHVFSGWVITKTSDGSATGITFSEGKFEMPKYDVTLVAQWEDVSKVAVIVDTNVKYESLAEAIAAATDGQTIQLIQDITQEEAILIDKNLTLDLNNKTFTVTNPSSEYSNRAIKVTAGTIVIENGTVDALSNETHNGGCWGGLRQEGGHLTCNNVTFKNYRSGGLGLKPVGGTLILNECTVLSEIGGGLELGNATVEVNNCTFTQTGTDANKIYGACFGMGKMGTLTINGGTYTSDNYSFYIYTSGGTINVNSGTFAGDVKTEMNNTQYPSAVGTINISGGTFDGVGENPIVFTAVTANDHISISGGVFDASIENQYCAEGYVPKDNGDGTYGVKPKDGAEIIRMDITPGSSAATVVGSGAYYKATPVSIYKSAKIKDPGMYIGFVLKDGCTFAEGDKLYVETSTAADRGYIQYFASADAVSPLKTTTYRNEAATGIELPAEVAGLQEFYIKRTTSDGDGSWNPTITAAYVTRVMYPTIDTVRVTINDWSTKVVPATDKTVAIEVPYSKDAEWDDMVVSFDIITNDNTQATIDGNSAWEKGVAKMITLTDKDDDATHYQVTISVAAAATDATLSALTVAGCTLTPAFDPAVLSYNVEVAYGTTPATLPAVTATKNHVGANVAEVIATALPGTSTYTVTAEDGSTKKVYEIHYTIAKWAEKVIFDGSYMTALATSPTSETELRWDVAGFSGVDKFSYQTTYGEAYCSDNDKTYSVENAGKYEYYQLKSGGTTKNSRYFKISVPTGYVAKFYVVYGSHSQDTEAKMYVGTAYGSTPTDQYLLLSTSDRYQLTGGMSEIVGTGDYYLNVTSSADFAEIRVYTRPGHYRDQMLGDGVIGTVCVPNNVAVEDIQGVTVYELMGRENQYGKLAFDEIVSGELEAGVPYVFQAHGDKMIMFYGDDHEDAPVYKGNGMYGTFVDQTLTELDDVYYFAQRALWSCDDLTSLNLPANRAYVKLSEINYLTDPNPAPGRRRITMEVNGEKVATDINNVQSDDVQCTKVMIDGQLYILRGEKMYDATGRLVK